MGFYLRKSFRMGPVRINLSKGGVGVSAGVPGLRVGVDANGKGYAHAGAGGVYYRESLGATPRGSAAAAAVTSVPVDIPMSSTPENLAMTEPRRAIGIYLMMPAMGAVVFVATSLAPSTRSEHVAMVIASAALGSLWPIPMIYPVWKNWSARRARARLSRLFTTGLLLTAEELAGVRQTLASFNRRERAYIGRRVHLELIRALVADRRVTGEELKHLAVAETLLEITADQQRLARSDGFRQVYAAAVADLELTEAEEAQLQQVREALRVPPEALREELAFVAELRSVREIREGKLPVTVPSAPLPKEETCHYEGPARLMKEKNVKSGQISGRRYSIKAWVADKEGTLFVTNKRVLLVHAGTTSIRVNAILDIEVDMEKKAVTITKDGATAPIVLEVEELLKVGALISSLISVVVGESETASQKAA